MTAEKIEQKLRSRRLTQTSFPPRGADDDWVVWVWCTDDPGLGAFVGQGEKYEDAFREAIEAYDFDQKEAAGQPEAEKTDGAPA